MHAFQKKDMKTKPFAIVLVFLDTIITSVALILLKSAAASFSFNLISMLTNFNLIGGLSLFALAAVLLLIAFKNGELSVLYPVIAASYIWVSILSPIFFLTDSMNLVKWVGVFFILIGITALGTGGSNE